MDLHSSRFEVVFRYLEMPYDGVCCCVGLRSKRSKDQKTQTYRPKDPRTQRPKDSCFIRNLPTPGQRLARIRPRLEPEIRLNQRQTYEALHGPFINGFASGSNAIIIRWVPCNALDKSAVGRRRKKVNYLNKLLGGPDPLLLPGGDTPLGGLPIRAFQNWPHPGSEGALA